MLELFTNPMSRGQIARWMIEETGAPYDERLVSYGPEMKGEAYLAVNPMGKVPAIRHNGRVVTEVAAICAYLADAFPEKALAPTSDERADYYRWLFFAAGPIEQAMTAKSAGWEPDEKQAASMGFGHFDLVMDVAAAKLSASSFICGDRFTAADVYVGSQINFGLQFGTLPSREEFVAYQARVTQREAFQKAKSRDTELIAAAQEN